MGSRVSLRSTARGPATPMSAIHGKMVAWIAGHTLITSAGPMKPTSTSLSQAVANLAADAVRIQRTLDASADADEAAFAEMLAKAPPSARPLLVTLAPARQVVTEHRVTCSIQVGISLDAKAEVRVAPLRLGFGAARREREQARSSIEVVVTGHPIPPGTVRPDTG